MSNPADETARIADSDAQRPSSRSGRDGRYAPGTMVAGRYRIASMLGAGGMGEVYRADDVRLDQPVALKFLPARLSRDPVLLGRLHHEVRLGRQISHPNVCRIHDIVDWEGATFIAMEFVDGEDLSRLLRRIGRLPHDKAVEIARGTAAGLMAAHAKGILHRDLKPANVMLDSHGEARIMDFGLALDAAEDDGTISGTPAYIAPEVLQGAAPTMQSDLYSLGLVMYELFTGARVHRSTTFPERLREIGSQVATPSDVVRDIDPVVERVILRCLDPDPGRRPRSARELIEALPGGDRLAAALAAGETPSPRLVAAAGSEGRLSPKAAWSLLGAACLLLGGVVALAAGSRYLHLFHLREPPEVHASRAAEMIRRLGLPMQPFHHHGFDVKSDYRAWIIARADDDWRRLRHGLPLVTYWLRSEPRPLIDTAPASSPKPGLEVPPQTASGSVAIQIDPRNRLYSLNAVAAPEWPARPLDWRPLLDAAGLTHAGLAPAPPRLIPPSASDARAAWSGKHPEDGTPIRVEAAAWRGTPVFFRIVAPWNEKDLRAAVPFGSGAFHLFLYTLIVLVMVVGAALAWRNLRARRGDRQGAVRVGLLIFAATFAGYVLTAHHAPVLGHELRILSRCIQEALFLAATFCLVYLALEPMIRRRWPEGLISWTRAIGGDLKNPMIGRDVLVGIVAGLLHAVLASVTFTVRNLFAGRPPRLWDGDIRLLDSTLDPLAHMADSFASATIQGLTFLIILMVLTVVLRRRALAVAAIFLLWCSAYLLASTELYLLPTFVALAALMTFVIARYGLLATVSMQFTFMSVFVSPLPDAFAWYTARASLAIVLVVSLSAWAFRQALGAQAGAVGSRQ